MDLLALYIAAAGVYVLVMSLLIDTANFRSHFMLRVIPITIGISLIFIGLVKSGLIGVVQSSAL